MAKKKKSHHERVARYLWKGSISFGLVNIPVTLASAEQSEKISFRLLDKRDRAPVGYKNYNKQTLKEVPRQEIIKAFEYEKGKYVPMTDADFKKANVKATSSIEIEDFIELNQVDFLLFEKPYYILPQKGGEKGYKLLHDVLVQTKKAAIAKVVLHTVQHLVGVMARGDYLILEILRFANEVKEVEEVHFLDDQLANTKVSDREIKIATQLVEDMTTDWDPDKYHNTYQEDLMKLINAKIKKGGAFEVEEPARETVEEPSTNLIDLTSLLQKSLNEKRPKKRARPHGA
jgi:DNA end-binding protein Ku